MPSVNQIVMSLTVGDEVFIPTTVVSAEVASAVQTVANETTTYEATRTKTEETVDVTTSVTAEVSTPYLLLEATVDAQEGS